MSAAAQRPLRTAPADSPYAMADAVPHLVWVAGPGGGVEYLNRACREYLGWPMDDLLGSNWRRAVHPDDLPRTDVLWEAAVQAGEEFQAEYRLRRADGEYRWHLGRARPQRAAGGGVARWFGTCTDVHDRRAAEEGLRRAESKMRLVWENAADGIRLTDAEGLVLAANPAYCRLVGKPREEVEGHSMAEAYAPGRREKTLDDYVRRFAARSVEAQYEAEVEMWDGRRRWFEVTNAHLDAPGEPPLLLSMFRDATERKRHEESLREREALLRGVIDNVPCRVFWKDRDSVFLGCNELFARDHGFPGSEAVVGRSDFDLGTPAEQAAVFRARDRRVIDAGEPHTNVEEPLTLPGGASITLLTSKVPLRDASGAVVGVLGVYQDITARKRLEEQLRQSQKLEAVGRLAGGIAHDFNNLLTVINGYADVLRTALHEGDPARGMVEEMRKAGERAAGLTRQLLAFGRKQLLRHRLLDLNAVVADLATILRRLVGDDVRLVLRPADDLLRVRADPVQVEQVVMNLAVNARDAMPRGGAITVETRNATLPGGQAEDGSDIRPGPYAMVAVSDTGCGMTDEVRAHVFEPFFTTKGPGKGTGLGLATVYGIVRQSGGHLEVETAPGRGTTFRVYLPGAAAEDGREGAERRA